MGCQTLLQQPPSPFPSTISCPGTVPKDAATPFVLLSTRLSEIRAFSDLFAEFQAAMEESVLPLSTRMVVLCNRPTYEFTAFQVVLRGESACMHEDMARSMHVQVVALHPCPHHFGSPLHTCEH